MVRERWSNTWDRHRNRVQGMSELTKTIPISSVVVLSWYLQKQTLKQILEYEKFLLEVILANTGRRGGSVEWKGGCIHQCVYISKQVTLCDWGLYPGGTSGSYVMWGWGSRDIYHWLQSPPRGTTFLYFWSALYTCWTCLFGQKKQEQYAWMLSIEEIRARDQ